MSPPMPGAITSFSLNFLGSLLSACDPRSSYFRLPLNLWAHKHIVDTRENIGG